MKQIIIFEGDAFAISDVQGIARYEDSSASLYLRGQEPIEFPFDNDDERDAAVKAFIVEWSDNLK